QQVPPPRRRSEGLDLNALANEVIITGTANTGHGRGQDERPPHAPHSGNRHSTFDRIGPNGPLPPPFGGIESEGYNITQELRHRMQSMESEMRELRKENTDLRTTTRDLLFRGRSSPRRRSRSRSRTPPRRFGRSRSPPKRRHHRGSSDESYSSSEEDKSRNHGSHRRNKRNRVDRKPLLSVDIPRSPKRS
ncbi:hypothetical protein PIB30_026775, partial [Stylosanthes scabra]|nr:hypothetical protein [Stylosanthes scabra]